MAGSRTIGRTRRAHAAWLQRGLFGSRRWRADCRCGWSGLDRRIEARAWADAVTHTTARNTRARRALGRETG